MRQGRFREDLYYRLNVFPIVISPLRARVEDIDTIASHFLAVYNRKYDKKVVLGRAAVDLMRCYAWPGNVRELQNIVERLVIVSDAQAVIDEMRMAPLLNLSPADADVDVEQGLRAILDGGRAARDRARLRPRRLDPAGGADPQDRPVDHRQEGETARHEVGARW